MPQIRKDPLSERWIIIAEGRDARPNEYVRAAPHRIDKSCPFCRGHERETPKPLAVYPQGSSNGSWTVRVVPNKYPAFLNHGDVEVTQTGLYHACDAVGRHEVIIESPRHVTSLSGLTETETCWLMHAYRDRLQVLAEQSRFRSALIFKNVGPEAGASLEHSHSQIVAMPMVPVELESELSASERLYQESGCCFFCRVLADELTEAQRLVAQTDRFVAICPYASRSPFELWVLPRQHSSHFERQTDADLADLARFLREMIEKIESRHPQLAYNYFIHSAPFDRQALPHYHWHLEIFPRLTTAAGFEWGAGYYINPVPPEQAAAILRASAAAGQ